MLAPLVLVARALAFDGHLVTEGGLHLRGDAGCRMDGS